MLGADIFPRHPDVRHQGCFLAESKDGGVYNPSPRLQQSWGKLRLAIVDVPKSLGRI